MNQNTLRGNSRFASDSWEWKFTQKKMKMQNKARYHWTNLDLEDEPDSDFEDDRGLSQDTLTVSVEPDFVRDNEHQLELGGSADIIESTEPEVNEVEGSIIDCGTLPDSESVGVSDEDLHVESENSQWLCNNG